MFEVFFIAYKAHVMGMQLFDFWNPRCLETITISLHHLILKKKSFVKIGQSIELNTIIEAQRSKPIHLVLNLTIL